jgi:colanic acid/amylovoran biosynthesis glycosyltransferase
VHIAYLVNQYPKVSHSFIRRELQALARQGFEITRIALRGWDDELVDEEDRLERDKTRYVLRTGGLALDVLRSLFTRPARFVHAIALAIKMGRRAERPLVIHLVYLAEACRIEGWLRAAGVQHLHAHFGTNSAEVAMYVHILGGPSWSFTVHGPEEFDKPQFIGLAEKVRRCAFVIAVSSFGRSQLFRNVEHPYWSKVHVVHCGIEKEFYQSAPRLYRGSQCLVCVGRLCEQKGQLLLIEATRRLRDQGIHFSLVLAGDGELRGQIEALIDRYRLESMVHITGWLSADQVREQILAARALVLPSFAEGLPVVIMEAMALRRPVISTYVAGIPELVHSGVHGWLVPAGDVEALAVAMRQCLEQSVELLERMGDSAHDQILLSHDIDIEVAKLAELFRHEINHSPPLVTAS